ncbi:MAG: hypothetical protein FVQ82_04630 [Planctomycetes bacterium]|nr:hypothetical protein [Planctomycetota bacterium]
MNNNETIYVAEYSHDQQCFHVQPLQMMIKDNIESVIDKRNLDFMPFGIYRTRDEAHEACAIIRKAHRRLDVTRN